MSVLVSCGSPDIDISPLRVAFRLPTSLVTDAGFTSAGWDLAPDSRSIIAIDDVARVEVTTLYVVVNLFDELRSRAVDERPK